MRSRGLPACRLPFAARSRRLGALVAVAASSVLVSPAHAASGTDRLLETSPPLVVSYSADSGSTRWRMSADEPGHARVIAADRSRALVVVRRCLSEDRDRRSGDSRLVALDSRTGKVRWEIEDVVADAWRPSRDWLLDPDALDPEAGGDRIDVVPLVDSDADEIRAVDARSGKTRWRAPAAGAQPVARTPSLVITVNRQPGPATVVLRALDAERGRERWTQTIADAHWTEVVADEDLVAVLTRTSGQDGRIEILDARTGVRRHGFVVDVRGVNLSGMLVTDGVALVGGFSGEAPTTTAAYDLATGAELWSREGRYTNSTAEEEAPAAVGTRYPPMRTPFVATDPAPGRTAALDLRTGAERWAVERADFVLGVAGTVVVGGRGMEYEGSYSVLDRLVGLDAGTGRVRWERRPGKSNVAPFQRRFPEIYTVASSVGTDAVYAHGGCAVTSLN